MYTGKISIAFKNEHLHFLSEQSIYHWKLHSRFGRNDDAVKVAASDESRWWLVSEDDKVECVIMVNLKRKVDVSVQARGFQEGLCVDILCVKQQGQRFHPYASYST